MVDVAQERQVEATDAAERHRLQANHCRAAIHANADRAELP